MQGKIYLPYLNPHVLHSFLLSCLVLTSPSLPVQTWITQEAPQPPPECVKGLF